jgi:hypothetical protein
MHLLIIYCATGVVLHNVEALVMGNLWKEVTVMLRPECERTSHINIWGRRKEHQRRELRSRHTLSVLEKLKEGQGAGV